MRFPVPLILLLAYLSFGQCTKPPSARHPFENWINALTQAYKQAPEEALPLDTFLLLRQRVLDIEKANPDQYFAVMARAYILWANYSDVQGEETNVLPWLQKAEKLLEKRQEPLAQELLSTVYNYLGSYYELNREDSGMANTYKQKSLAIDKRFGKTENLLIAYMNLGFNAVSQGKYEQAFVYFDSALVYQAALPLDSNSFVNHCGVHYQIARAFHHQGLEWWEEGRTQAAQVCFERALKEFQEGLAILALFPNTPSNNVRFFVQQSLARTLMEMNAPQQNADLLQASQVLPDLLPGNAERDNSLKSLAYAHWAYALAKNGAIPEARKTFDIGQRFQTDLLAGKYPTGYNEQNYARFLFLKAQMLEVIAEKSTAVFDFQASLDGYDALLQYLERQEREMVSEEGLDRLRKFYAQAGGKAVRLAMNLFRRTGKAIYKEKAFQLAEQSKAGNLRQTIGFALSGADLQGDMKKLHDQEQYFRQNITRLETLFYQDTLPRKQRVWQDSVLLLRKQYAQFVQGIRLGKQKKAQQYYQLKFGKTDVSTRTLQQQLPNPETAIVEYQWYGPNGYAFVITQKRFEVVDLVLDTSLLGHIEALQENLRFEKPMKEYARHALALYQGFVEPIVRNAISTDIKELIVVPDKNMAGMVLENLITQTPAPNATFADLPYLLRQFSISYAYSIGSNWLAKERSTKYQKPSEAFVGFIASPDGSAHGAGIEVACSTAPLPQLSKMTHQIGQQYFSEGRGKVVSRATKKDYYQYAPQADILHFALHGCLSEQDQYLSNKLQFLPDNQGGNISLHSGEIMQSGLKARLAVLASCNTAQGAWNRNEGLKSIARSFFIAGCPAVLATLHPVNEATTANILEHFYPALLAGSSKSHALKKAKLAFLSKADPAFVHPKYWANMVLIGDPAPMH